MRIVWLFSLVLGYSRLSWARFVAHQDLQTMLRCHMAAFAALGGVPRQVLYDRMKTAVIGEDDQAHIVYNRALIDFAGHYGFHPKACRPYRAKTKGKVERPFRYIREDFFLARSFRNLDDLNAQLSHWLAAVANPRRRYRGAPLTRLLRRGRPPPRHRKQPAMTGTGDGLPVLERIRRTLIALRMPRALEVLDHAVRQLERGEASALELIDTLLAEE